MSVDRATRGCKNPEWVSTYAGNPPLMDPFHSIQSPQRPNRLQAAFGWIVSGKSPPWGDAVGLKLKLLRPTQNAHNVTMRSSSKESGLMFNRRKSLSVQEYPQWSHEPTDRSTVIPPSQLGQMPLK